MGLDGRMPQRKAQTLCNREAAMLYGEGWECAENGAEVWQRLKLDAASSPAPTLLASEELAVNRAHRLLKRHRLAAQMIVQQLQQRATSLAYIPFSRLIAGNTPAELREQVAVQQQRLDQLPTAPTVHRLDPDHSAELPADAKKSGTSIWFLDKASMTLFSREITRVAIEPLNGIPTLVYETTGTMADGQVVRRSCAHHFEGLKVLNHNEIAFLDPMAAREYLNRHMSSSRTASGATPPVTLPATLPATPPAAPPKPRATTPVIATPAKAEPPAKAPVEPILDGEFDEALALRPFDEAMLRSR